MQSKTETLGSIIWRADKNYCESHGTCYLELKPAFQREYECWDEKMKTKLIESILKGYAINPIWVAPHRNEDIEDVFDGMHRLTTIRDYMQNKFALNKDLSRDFAELVGKKFADLNAENKNKIRNYNLTINILEYDILEDDEKMQDMYHILNRSSVPLNEYEFNRVKYGDFCNIIADQAKHFKQTHIYRSRESTRGKIEEKMIKFLSLSEETVPTKFSSVNNIATQWQIRELGKNGELMAEAILTKSPEWASRFSKLANFMNRLKESELLNDSNMTDDKEIENLFVLARLCALVKDTSILNRHLDNLTSTLREDIYDNEDLNGSLDCERGNRNAKFQKKLLQRIDNLISEEIKGSAKRRFTIKEKKDKLRDQNNLCPHCNRRIEEYDKYDGDHIVPWASGGPTTYDNLQVLHRRCHQQKSLGVIH